MQKVDRSLTRWMYFVDGENITIRGEALAEKEGVKLFKGQFYLPDTFLWVPSAYPPSPQMALQALSGDNVPVPIRAHYYTSSVGSDEVVTGVRSSLRDIGFHPEVFRKTKGRPSKGVDITLAKDLLSHGFLENYDVAVLFTGDGDFLPLIEEVQRRGRIVILCSFENEGLSPALRLAADIFVPMDIPFLRAWRFYAFPTIGKERVYGNTNAWLIGPRGPGTDLPDHWTKIRFWSSYPSDSVYEVDYTDEQGIYPISPSRLDELYGAAKANGPVKY